MTFFTITIGDNETVERDSQKEVNKIIKEAKKKGKVVKVNGEEVKDG